MFTKAYAVATAERAIKTFAQSFVAYAIASGAVGLFDFAWSDAASVAGLATVLSVLTSVGSAGVGGDGPSLADETLEETDGDHRA